MRSLLTLCLMLLACFPAAGLPESSPSTERSLVRIVVDEESGPALARNGFRLIVRLPDAYLALLDAEQIDRLEHTDLEHEILVPRDDVGREYFIDFEREAAEPPLVAPARILTLYRGADYEILSLPAELAERIPAGLFDLQRVWRRPLRFVTEPWIDTVGERELPFDPDIQAMVDAVEAGDLENQVQTLEDFGTRHSQYNGGYLASLWIRDQFLAYGYTDVSFHDYNGWNDNVVCVKPGAVFPDQVLVLGGHYDSTSWDVSDAPGADDNATGTSGVLQAARVMADHDFERSIVFIAFSGEEQGLVGSEAWAEDAADAGMNIVGMVNLDMLGYLQAGDEADLDIISNEGSQPLFDLAVEAIGLYVPGHPVVEGHLTSGSSDHASFWAHGFRAIFLYEDSDEPSPYIHTANDVVGLSANNFAFMLANVKASIAACAVLARPFHIAIDHEPLTHSEEHGPFGVTAGIYAVEPLDETSLQLRYRVDGGEFIVLPLLPGSEPDHYEASIPAQAHGSRLEYYLSAADVLGNTQTHPDGAPHELHSFRAGVSFVLVDDVEQDLGWTLGAPGDDADTGHWIRADPVGTNYQSEDDHTPDPGHICFVTGNADPGDSSGANDVDGGRTTLLSPLFDLSDAEWAALSYWRWYTDETYHDDDFFVDISNDGGESWVELEVVSDSAYPWVKAVFDDLAAIIPLSDRMRLRFIAEDRGNGSLVEALIDDVEIVAVTDAITGGEAPASPAARLEVFPNPFNPRTNIRFTLNADGLTRLRIFSVSGAELATLLDAPLSAGEHGLEWDAGRLASGVYFLQLEQAGQVIAHRKVTLLK